MTICVEVGHQFVAEGAPTLRLGVDDNVAACSQNTLPSG